MTCLRLHWFRRTHRTVILAFLAIALGAASRVSGQAPPKPSPPLTAHQQERLKERDRMGKQAAELQAQRQLLEAIRAAEAKRDIEREVLGVTSDDAIGSLELLAQLHADREDWAAAKEACSEMLELRIKTLGEDHWKVIDARWLLADVESTTKMD